MDGDKYDNLITPRNEAAVQNMERVEEDE